jgi:hypothetical protein
VKETVVAYITCGTRLLVIAQPDDPTAGCCVPCGSTQDGETPEDAAWRIVDAEAGLPALELEGFLGTANGQRFFHFRQPEPCPPTWVSTASDGSDDLINFYWDDLTDGVPDLIADHTLMLDELMQRL